MKKFIIFSVLLLVAGCKKENPKVLFTCSAGSFTVELYPEQAPVTVANFLKYVRENRYKDATFYRAVTLENQPANNIKIEVIQGGLWADQHPDRLPPIAHETTEKTGIHHLDGVISMARLQPGTASDAFFICIGSQPSLDYGGMRNPDGQGFAAFGQVIEGMNVVRFIQKYPANGQYLEPQLPVSIRLISIE